MERLDAFRRTIDEIDHEWVAALARRFAVTEEVGRYKQQFNLPAADPQREGEQITALRALADEHGLDPDLVEQVFQLITERVRSRHREIAASQEATRSVPRSRPRD